MISWSISPRITDTESHKHCCEIWSASLDSWECRSTSEMCFPGHLARRLEARHRGAGGIGWNGTHRAPGDSPWDAIRIALSLHHGKDLGSVGPPHLLIRGKVGSRDALAGGGNRVP